MFKNIIIITACIALYVIMGFSVYDIVTPYITDPVFLLLSAAAFAIGFSLDDIVDDITKAIIEVDKKFFKAIIEVDKKFFGRI